MQVMLREAGEEYPIDLADLDAQVRQGVISGDAELLHAPWTGASFRRLRDLPVMFDALDTPDARFADYLRQRRPAWLTGGLAAMVMGSAMVQAALAGSQQGWAAQRLGATFHQWMVGLEPTMLDGRWWTPWTSQLVHSDLLHALFNVPILAYCGYRVEQALAPSGALAVVAAAVLLGAVAIVGFDDAPVVGSSIAAYGLWAAQIAVGLRMDRAVPRDIRGRYGMGNLVFFAPLYAASLFNASVSQLGHLGGIVGGALVAFFLSAETMAPHRDFDRARQRVLLLTALLALAPAPLLAVATRLPRLAYAPYVAVHPPDAGLALTLPARMAEHPAQLGAISAWKASSTTTAPLFADLFFMEDAAPTTAPWLAAFWGEQLGSTAEVLALPAPLGPGWTAHAFQVGSQTVIEHQLQRGRWLVRAGYLLPQAARSPFSGRAALYAASLATLQVAEPPTLSAARARHAAAPDSSLHTVALARELRYAGRPAEADALLVALETSAGGWQWEAARERLTLWLEYPSAANATLDDAAQQAWLLRYLQAAPLIDTDLHQRGTQWLADHAACDAARQHQQDLIRAGGPADLLAPLEAHLAGPCPAPPP